MSLKDNEKAIGKLRGPNGRRLCRWDGNEVVPPRRTFCSDACSHEWRVRSSVTYLRQCVYNRDRGVCAKCGRDTRLTKIRLEDAQTRAMERASVFSESPMAEWRKDQEYILFLRTPPLTLTVYEAERPLWQADHLVPVAAGGGLVGLSGLRTLCVWCHKDVSKEFMKNKRNYT